jgi:hypothetical protein
MWERKEVQASAPAMRLPLCAAEVDSEVTVAASGYSPPTPMPRQNLRHVVVECAVQYSEVRSGGVRCDVTERNSVRERGASYLV